MQKVKSVFDNRPEKKEGKQIEKQVRPAGMEERAADETEIFIVPCHPVRLESVFIKHGRISPGSHGNEHRNKDDKDGQGLEI
jgi:hypothetical protein